MARLSALVASLACSVERATIGSRAVARDVTQLPTGVAFHSLRLAISRIVIWPPTLVARCGSVSRHVEAATSLKASSSPKPSAVATSSWGSHHRLCCGIGVWTVSSKVSRLSAGVAIATSSLSADPQGWTVRLNVTKALAVIALLSIGCPGRRALVGLMAWLLAIVTKPFGGCAHLRIMAHVATFVACSARKRRHGAYWFDCSTAFSTFLSLLLNIFCSLPTHAFPTLPASLKTFLTSSKPASSI